LPSTQAKRNTAKEACFKKYGLPQKNMDIKTNAIPKRTTK
jgi:hypothetical protein